MQTYCFGEFELDLEARQLRLRGEPVHLENRPFDLLTLLVREPGRLHTRDEIIAALWPAKIVIDFDAGLNTLVRKVRHALGDSSDHPQYVETVPARGYRFIAPVIQMAPSTEPAAVRADLPVVPAEVPVVPAAVPAFRRRLQRILPIAAVLLAAAIGFAVWRSADVAPSHTRIAVLPFETLTGDSELAYLASGLASETSAALARIELPGLAIIGVVSAKALRESALPLAQFASQVGVDFVVDSSIRLDGSHIRVTSHLIRAEDGEQVWTASFDRELTNVLGLQRDLGIAIAEQVRQKLAPDVAASIHRRQTENPQAYALYLKGREYWMRFQPTSVNDALAFYDQAVSADPGYGLAWAGMAHAATTATLTADAPPSVALPRARHALEHALRLGPDLAETWVAQGAYSLFIDWDFPAAESASRRAIELDPNSAMAHMTLAMALSVQDRHVEARAAMRRARELDPLFPLIFANSAYIERAAKNPEGAIEYGKQAIAMDPEFWVGYFQHGLTLREQQDYIGALNAFEAADKYSGSNGKSVASRAYMLACLGRDEEGRELIDLLVARSTERYVSPYLIAFAEAGLGNVESVEEWLEVAISSRDINLTGFFRRTQGEIGLDHPHFEWLYARCGPVTAGTD